MTERGPFRRFKTGPEVIRLAGMLCIRSPLSLRKVEDPLRCRPATLRRTDNGFG